MERDWENMTAKAVSKAVNMMATATLQNPNYSKVAAIDVIDARKSSR